MHGLLDRYLLREVTLSWVAVTLVLLAVMLATRFASFLGEAAAGELPRALLLKVITLSSLQYLVVLVPVSLLLAVMLSLGRLYRDNEVAAMAGCGIGLGTLYRPFLLLAGLLSAATALLAFEVGPWAGRSADYLVRDAQRLVQYTPFEPGQFRELLGGRVVVYTAGMDTAANTLDTVFAQIEGEDADEEGADGAQSEPGVSIVIARSGTQTLSESGGDRAVTLTDGWRYRGTPGAADYDVVRFEQFYTRITPPPFLYLSGKQRVRSTAELLAGGTAKDYAELHWRLAAPVSVLLLGLLSVPLAHVRPRQGRYGKVAVGILIYLFYSNLLGLGQTWIAKGAVSPALGLWWVHALVLCAALVLIARRQGWLR